MITILLAFFSVFLLIESFIPKYKLLEKLGLTYLLAIGGYTFSTFLIMASGITLNKNSLSILVAFVFSISLFVFFKKNNFKQIFKKINIKWKKVTKVDKLLVMVIAALIGFVLLYGWFWPATDWDSLVLYDFRAKSFAISGGMDEAISHGYFFGYPLLTSLSHAWVYILTNGYPSMIHALMYVAFLTIFYIQLKKETNKTTALLGTILLGATRPIFGHAQMTYSNLPYTAYLTTGYLYLYRFLKEKKQSSLIISSLLIGFSTWTRSVEPFWITAILVTIIILFLDKNKSSLKKIKNGGFYFLIISLIRYPWLSFEGMHLKSKRDVLQRSPEFLATIFSFDLNNLTIVTQYLYKSMIQPQIILYIAFLIAFFGRKKEQLYDYFFLTLVLMNLALFFLGTLILSQTFKTWNQIGGSITRLSMIFIPLLIFEIAITFSYLNSKKK